MESILADIVDEIDIKPNKTKLILKWVITISGSLIVTAFLLGQLKMKHINRLNRIETKLVKMKAVSKNDFNIINARIDKVYDDGILMFNEFQENNNKKLGLIIDYSDTNADLLKRLLEINTLDLEPQIEKAKSKILVPVAQELPKEYINEIFFIEIETNDTLFSLTAATKKYINNIDRKLYKIDAIIENPQYPGRFDVSYRNK